MKKQKEIPELTFEQLLDKATKYCAFAERCQSDVEKKMVQWSKSTEHNEKVIDFLYEHNFLNDKRYCEAYMHDKVLYQGWGKKKIQLMLHQKQLPEKEINAALQSFDATQYNQVLSDLIAKKRTQCTGSDFEIKAQITRFCLQRGFLYEEINEVLKSLDA